MQHWMLFNPWRDIILLRSEGIEKMENEHSSNAWWSSNYAEFTPYTERLLYTLVDPLTRLGLVLCLQTWRAFTSFQCVTIASLYGQFLSFYYTVYVLTGIFSKFTSNVSMLNVSNVTCKRNMMNWRDDENKKYCNISLSKNRK